MTGSDLVRVRLLGVPVALRQASVEQGAELLREMTLVASSDADAHVPARLLEVAHEVMTLYGPYTQTQAQALEDAYAAGVDVVEELVYDVPPAAGPFARRLREVLEEADDFCRQGRHLLALAAPEAVRAFRTWQLREFERQVAGEPPVPWPQAAP